jgi:integrase
MATIYQRGGRWYLQWSDTKGQHRLGLSKFGVKTEAEAKNYRYAKELELGTGKTIISSAPRFKSFSQDYLHWYKHEYPSSYDRMVTIIDVLLPAFGDTPLNLIDPQAVEFWKTKRLSQVSPATVAKELRGFKAMIKRAVIWGTIQTHPFPYVQAPQEVNSKPASYYTSEDMKALYNVKSPYVWHWKLFANTGMRRAEGQSLKIENVLSDRIRVISTSEARTKSRRWREIPINKPAREALDALIGDRKTGYVLPRIDGRSLTRAFDRDRKKAHLDGNLHRLRHTFISHLVMAGWPLRRVQVIAGHANYSTTEKYAHIAPDALRGFEGFEV